ncbi:MAG: multiubiquitin domain-containing protein [Candidatus Tectomicrobia bacterium]|nr:multiubiquitin domain-containing protein [Candidatus Tectomicrobia bacterium]
MAVDNLAPDKNKPEHKVFTIQIDRAKYEWSEEKISGAQLRDLPSPPIPIERDLFQVVPGHSDRKIKDDDTIEVYDGLRIFTAPNTINPGVSHSDL